jgi:hypothetical protein
MHSWSRNIETLLDQGLVN